MLFYNVFSQFDYYKPESGIVKKEIFQDRHFAGEMKLSLSPNLIMNPDIGVKAAGGIGFQVFLSKRISLDADLVFGRKYFQGGPGIIAIPFWILTQTGSGFVIEDRDSFSLFLVMIVAGALSFEHMSYHIPLEKNWELSPYVSFLRYKQIDYESISPDFSSYSGQFSFATGLRAEKYFGRFFISPYIEYNIGYKDRISGINTGAGFGYCFNYKARTF
jgi:hypothetical protein